MNHPVTEVVISEDGTYIINNLESSAADMALSANMGKYLNDTIQANGLDSNTFQEEIDENSNAIDLLASQVEGNTNSIAIIGPIAENAEPYLGDPLVNGYILASTVDGQRAWVNPKEDANSIIRFNYELGTGDRVITGPDLSGSTLTLNAGYTVVLNGATLMPVDYAYSTNPEKITLQYPVAVGPASVSVFSYIAVGGFGVANINNIEGNVTIEPSTSVKTDDGGKVTILCATTEQGETADSALQPGDVDNVSELINDALYITVDQSKVTSVNTRSGAVTGLQDIDEKGATSGYCPLDITRKVPNNFLPVLDFNYGDFFYVQTLDQRNALTVSSGDVCFVSCVECTVPPDAQNPAPADSTSASYGATGIPAGQTSSGADIWVEIAGGTIVHTVNQQSGDVVLSAADVNAIPDTEQAKLDSALQPNVINTGYITMIASTAGSGTYAANFVNTSNSSSTMYVRNIGTGDLVQARRGVGDGSDDIKFRLHNDGTITTTAPINSGAITSTGNSSLGAVVVLGDSNVLGQSKLEGNYLQQLTAAEASVTLPMLVQVSAQAIFKLDGGGNLFVGTGQKQVLTTDTGLQKGSFGVGDSIIMYGSFDNVKQSGFYTTSGTQYNTDGPTTNINPGTLTVNITTYETTPPLYYGSQVFIDQSTGYLYARQINSTVWSDWSRLDNKGIDAVTTVNGATGDVLITCDNLYEGAAQRLGQKNNALGYAGLDSQSLITRSQLGGVGFLDTGNTWAEDATFSKDLAVTGDITMAGVKVATVDDLHESDGDVTAAGNNNFTGNNSFTKNLSSISFSTSGGNFTTSGLGNVIVTEGSVQATQDNATAAGLYVTQKGDADVAYFYSKNFHNSIPVFTIENDGTVDAENITAKAGTFDQMLSCRSTGGDAFKALKSDRTTALSIDNSADLHGRGAGKFDGVVSSSGFDVLTTATGATLGANTFVGDQNVTGDITANTIDAVTSMSINSVAVATIDDLTAALISYDDPVTGGGVGSGHETVALALDDAPRLSEANNFVVGQKIDGVNIATTADISEAGGVSTNDPNTWTANNNFTNGLAKSGATVATESFVDGKGYAEVAKVDQNFTGVNNFTGGLQKNGLNVATLEDVQSNSATLFDNPHTWTANNNFTGGLQVDGVDVTGSAGGTSGITRYTSLHNLRTESGDPIALNPPTTAAILSQNLRTLAASMDNSSIYIDTVGGTNTEAYYLTGISYGTLVLTKKTSDRVFGNFYTKVGSKEYGVSFDSLETSDIAYQIFGDARLGTNQTWTAKQTYTSGLAVDATSGTQPSLLVTNTSSGSGVELIGAASANGTTRWKVDNGGHTTQAGSSLLGETYNSGSDATLEVYNENAQAKFIDCIDSTGENIFFVKRSSNSGQMQVTGSSAQIYSQNTITSGGNMTCLSDMNVSGALTVNGVSVSDQTFAKYGNSNPPSNYLTIIRNGNHSGVLYLKGDVSTDSTPFLNCSTTSAPGVSVKILTNGDISTTAKVICDTVESENGGVFNHSGGSNTAGTIQVTTGEQSYADLWMDCSVEDGNAYIKLRSSGWLSASGGTDQATLYSSTATIGQRNDGTTHNSATVPALTLKNLSTAYGARTLACIDDLGNDTFQVLSRGEVKIEGARAELTVAGDIHNSGYKIDTSNLNAGIVSANSSTIYTSTTTGNHAVGGTLTVAGSVVTSTSLHICDVDVGAKITEYQATIATQQATIISMEARLTALEVLCQGC